MKSNIQKIRELVDIQGSKGNWDSSPYMTGLFNGLEMALCTLEKREPMFRDYVKPPFLTRVKRYMFFRFYNPTQAQGL